MTLYVKATTDKYELPIMVEDATFASFKGTDECLLDKEQEDEP